MAKIDFADTKGDALFNSALGVVIRINTLLNYCMECANEFDSFGWFQYLHSLRREISSKLKEKEDEEIQDLLDDVEEDCYSSSKMKRHSMPKELYKKLDRIERILRKKADSVGLLVPDKNDPKYSL